MKFSKLGEHDYQFFLIFSLFWVFLGWLGFLLALFGIFYFWIILPLFILGLIFTFFYLIKKGIFQKISKEFLFVSLFAIAVVVAYSFFVTPTVFSGRDQGSFSEAAIHISQNHDIYFSNSGVRQFFQIYGPGKALNFPGFYYVQSGDLTSSFPLPYSSWLAIFYSFFSLNGLILANAILLFLFFISFYLLLRPYLPGKYSFCFLLIAASAFTTFWFFKYTLTENMALFLLWFSILSVFYSSFEEKVSLSLTALAASAGLLFFTRIEGIAFFFTLFLAFILVRKYKLKEILKSKFSWIGILVFLALFAFDFFKNISFYKEIVKAVIRRDGDNMISSASFWSKLVDQYHIFFLYGLLGVLIVGAIGILYFIKKKDYHALIPFLVVVPSFLYLLSPMISGDNPWMLRRFAFSILPCFLFYSAVFLKKWGEQIRIGKIILPGAIVVFLALNFVPAWKYFSFSEDKGLLSQTKTISEYFSSRDLVLVDQKASGSGFSMIAGPLSDIYGKNAVYMVNPLDANKIDFKSFEHVFLIIPNSKTDYYQMILPNFSLSIRATYQLDTARLSSKKTGFPKKSSKATNLTIFEIQKQSDEQF
jgi:hypothetical protein